MAVCNLFNTLSNLSGNFIMFSQYVEDITRNFTDGDNWKIVPTKFVALNIDYATLKSNRDFIDRVLNKGNDTLNSGIPKYFQNCFENACAYGRTHTTWSPLISRNLFWNCMFDGKFTTTAKYSSGTSETKYIPEVVYYGDINMHSYNEHQGMGYGEIYCYIPTDAGKMNCQVVEIDDRSYDTSNSSVYLEGFVGDATKSIENYSQVYSYNKDFSMTFDDDTIGQLQNSVDSKYGINTIVVLYSIFNKLNDTWQVLYSNIPMGMYFAGNFDDSGNLTNVVTKYVSTSYGSGTSYGLRICTRFSATSNGNIINTDIVTDDSGYTNMCQLMTAMSENLSRMMEISQSAHNTTQSYKETLAAIKNNRTNVPYVKDVNGVDCWFVNGRFVSAVNMGIQTSCVTLTPETIQKRLDNLMDTDPTNDWSYIEDPNGCDCNPIGNKELAAQLGLDPDEYPDYGGGSTGGTVDFDIAYADSTEVIEALNRL